MKQYIVFSLLCTLAGLNVSFSQSIQDIINHVDTANLQLSVNELSGEQATMINGVSQMITSRVQSNNDLVADYIEERLSAMPNLNVAFQNFNTSGKNIIATQLGKTNPDNIYMICAHYDSVADYCADDNATGVAAVLEVARILSQQCTDNTIVYALWDEEEIGLLGSRFYAEQAAGDSNGATSANILGVINMDMIGFDSDAPGTDGDNDFDIDVRDIANSIAIKNDLLDILNTYTFDLDVTVVNPGTEDSDHSSFWDQGYSAVLVGESWSTGDKSIHYHTADDRVGDIDFQYMTEMTKLIAAYTATKSGLVALDNTISQTGTSLIANQTAASYQWYNCDSETEIPGETNSSFSPTTSGNYAVEISTGSCIEISSCINYQVLSTEEFTDEDIKFYPNPVTSVLKIENLKATELTIIINDISGKRVYTNTFQYENFEIDLNNSRSGVYFVNVISKTKSSIFKIVKE